MKKGQKSIRGGIEDFLCPFTDVYITQGPNESYSHKGIMAWDVRGVQSGIKYPYYAPCTCKCIWTYPASGQAKWQSVDKVRFSNGRVDYATFMTAHDDSFDATVGMVVPQGNKLGNMGKKSDKNDITGVHCHIEISQSNDATWKKNSAGNYMFNNEVDPEDCFFMDNTNIISGSGKWKYLKDVPVDEPKTEAPTEPPVDEDKVKIEELEKQVKELTETNELQRNEIKNRNAAIDELSAQITILENRIVEVTEERDKLKEEQPRKIFACSKDGDYQIHLYAKEELFIK